MNTKVRETRRNQTAKIRGGSQPRGRRRNTGRQKGTYNKQFWSGMASRKNCILTEGEKAKDYRQRLDKGGTVHVAKSARSVA